MHLLVVVLDVLPLLALVVVIPDLVRESVETHFEGNGTSEDGGNKDRVLLEEGVVDGAS